MHSPVSPWWTISLPLGTAIGSSLAASRSSATGKIGANTGAARSSRSSGSGACERASSANTPPRAVSATPTSTAPVAASASRGPPTATRAGATTDPSAIAPARTVPSTPITRASKSSRVVRTRISSRRPKQREADSDGRHADDHECGCRHGARDQERASCPGETRSHRAGERPLPNEGRRRDGAQESAQADRCVHEADARLAGVEQLQRHDDEQDADRPSCHAVRSEQSEHERDAAIARGRAEPVCDLVEHAGHGRRAPDAVRAPDPRELRPPRARTGRPRGRKQRSRLRRGGRAPRAQAPAGRSRSGGGSRRRSQR